MKIGITGVTGFIGSHVLKLARERGHEVIGFTRDASRPVSGCIETRKFSPHERVVVEGCDALVHLAGESVAGLWTSRKRRMILESRVMGTRQIADAIRLCPQPPGVLVSGSAVGFYGDTGENEVDEDSAPGTGFLAEVCRAWEAEAIHARSSATRVVLLRTSMVLGRNGGAMKYLMPLFRAGLGGKLASGRQWMSWIHVEDEAALALFAVENAIIEGPVNAAAPFPCRNAEFTKSLARAVHRPAFLNVPAFVLKAALGDFSHELLDSKRVLLKRAPDAGYKHRFPSLDAVFPQIT